MQVLAYKFLRSWSVCLMKLCHCIFALFEMQLVGPTLSCNISYVVRGNLNEVTVLVKFPPGASYCTSLMLNQILVERMT